MGVDVNGVDDDRRTALHAAAELGRMELCEVLVARGANVGAVNKQKRTAAAVARMCGHEAVAVYLEGLSGEIARSACISCVRMDDARERARAPCRIAARPSHARTSHGLDRG